MGLFKRIIGIQADKIADKFRKAPQLPEFPEPFGLKIGGIIEVNALNLRIAGDNLLQDSTKFNGRHIIKGYGKIEIDSITTYHRFYCDDEIVFQVTTTNGQDEELMVFCEQDEVYPQDDDEVAFWIGEDGIIGDTHFQIPDGPEYMRVWVPRHEGRINPVEFTEYMTMNREEDVSMQINHTGMLYSRWVDVSETISEFLLVDMEDTGESLHVEISVGYILDNTEFKVI